MAKSEVVALTPEKMEVEYDKEADVLLSRSALARQLTILNSQTMT